MIFRQAGTDAGIFVSVEERYSSASIAASNYVKAVI
jgi:hypothetical protein